MTPLRVVIVDDEPPARLVLREFLDARPDVALVAECANGFEAVKAVSDLRPDLLLLDVQMPKLDGFEVLELVGRDTLVVFTTAYDEYALRAFEVHAVDYLLKPFSEDRLLEALTRVRQRLASSGTLSGTLSGASSGVLSGVLSGAPSAPPRAADLRPPGTRLARIVVRSGADVHVVPIDRVDYVEAQDDYVAVHTADRTLLKEQTLVDLEAGLDARRFVRIHRSFILNLDRLVRLEPTGKDSRIAVLRDGTRLPVSRTGYTRLQTLL